MFDYRKLKARIIEIFGSQAEFAKAINKDAAYVSRYISGRSEFNQSTVLLWAESLRIQTEDIGLYFFAH